MLRCMSARIISCRLFITLVLFCTPALVKHAWAAVPVTDVQAQLRPLLQHPGLKNARIGVVVGRLDTHETVFTQGADDLLVPASNVKLFTTAAALSHLGPDYQFKTEILGRVNPDGTVASALALRGYGDPYMTPERLGFVASRLYYMGVRHIQGDLVMDDSYFAPSTRMAQGWQEDLTSHAYMAPAGALSVGFNAMMVHVLPAKVGSGPATIMLDPTPGYGKVTGAVATVSAGPTRINVDVWPQGRSSTVRVSGQIAAKDPGRGYWRRIDNPPQFAGEVFKQTLQQHGITVSGNVCVGPTPQDLPLLYTALSPRLGELLGPLNKYSNNFMAMQVALVLGADRYGAPATWAKAAQAMDSFLTEKVGLTPGSYTLRNASGLHSVNQVTANQVMRVLRYMYASPIHSVEFNASLAVAAGSGTLQDRMLGTPAAHRVRAKTGTLAKASALSGYVMTYGGVPLVFSLLVNNYRHIADVWAAQDRFADGLATLVLSPPAGLPPQAHAVAEQETSP
jgi:D-alanyl-D-alanine carboxypeptidase/D-alanyl-D-alanine-endopeptidase (penicillin-binding protein 4)